MTANRKGFNALDRAVLHKTAQVERLKREPARSIAQHLAMMGALGWLFVTPPLLLGFLGRWLDRTLGTGFELTAVMLLAGIGFGGWLAWRRMGEAGVLGDPPKKGDAP